MTEVLTQKPMLRSAVAATASRLQEDILSANPNSATKAVLSQLRRQAGQPIEHDPLAIERVLTLLSPPLSRMEIGRGDHASPSEEAAYNALTLFALHMQSAKKPVHVKDVSFATACGKLNLVSESKSMKPRFDAMVLATNPQLQLVHARSLVSLLRSKEIGFDYGQFAQDLRSLRNPERRPGVLLRWGRDFVLASYPNEDNQESPKN